MMPTRDVKITQAFQQAEYYFQWTQISWDVTYQTFERTERWKQAKPAASSLHRLVDDVRAACCVFSPSGVK